jgi:hypothetical protein
VFLNSIWWKSWAEQYITHNPQAYSMPIVQSNLVTSAAQQLVQHNNIPRININALGIPAVLNAQHPFFQSARERL